MLAEFIDLDASAYLQLDHIVRCIGQHLHGLLLDDVTLFKLAGLRKRCCKRSFHLLCREGS